MRHHLFAESPTNTYPIALLIKASCFITRELDANYMEPLTHLGVSRDEVVAFTLEYKDGDKAPAGFIKEYLAKLLPGLDSLGTKFLFVNDTNYFKVLAGKPKAEPHYGYALPCKIKGFEHMTVVLGLNHRVLIYNPPLQSRLSLALKTLADVMKGAYAPPGQNIIHSAEYPTTPNEIRAALKRLHAHPKLSCDIEGFSLNFHQAGIGTIAFAWDEHNGIAFACDYHDIRNTDQANDHYFGVNYQNPEVRALLREFFETYQGELTFHYANYDVKAQVYALWMKNLLDREGMLKGLDIMCRRMHDTKVIAYLATNSTAGNQLSLKTLAHEFAGNWAVEVTDITKVPLPQLLQYNLVDALSTNYVRNKYEPIMEADNQGDLYRGLFLESLKLIMQIELVGMPMSAQRLAEVKSQLQDIQAAHLNVVQQSPLIQTLNLLLQQDAQAAANAKLKIKQHPLSKFADVRFNPNSGQQLQRLLYEQMGLPVIDLTDTKQPATGAETLEKLVNHTSVQGYKDILNALISYSKVTKILSTFIPAFEAGLVKDDSGILWLHGLLHLGGTVSGRLSSTDPNMQNIPANSMYGKLIKEIFTAPKQWLFGGADFNSLEDYVSALTTKDPNKLNVYIMGFDGHCLRAAYYYRDQLMHIDLTSPASVNSIKKTHPELRQGSKTPTFALTYQGTYHTLMTNLGWDMERAKRIEASYHELYKVSDEYVARRLKQANKDGFVEVAFGLRVRTPLIKQVVWGGDKVPFEAAAEGRTAGNALGQSYGLLNNRAAVDFFKKVWASKYRYDILPVGLIHDAIYIIIRDDAEIVTWANRELIASMRWQDLPELQHPQVKLGAALDIFWPNWAHPTTLPNDADQATIERVCEAAKAELAKKLALPLVA